MLQSGDILRLPSRPVCMGFAAIALWCVGGAAHAQDERLGVPLVPVLPVARPVVADPGLSLTTSAEAAYDDNIFRTNSRRTPSVDDFILTPGVRGVYWRQVGLNDVRVDADLAYSFFTLNPDRSRGRADLHGSGTFRVAGVCQIQPDARILRQQSDYGDINAARDNFQTVSNLSLRVSCPRTVGFYPVADISRRTTTNSTAFDFADLRSVSLLGGIGYSRPSIGQAVLYYRHLNSERPTINVTNRAEQVGVTFHRAVVSRVTLDLDLSYLDVTSRGANVRPYRGPGWDAKLELKPVPAASFSVETERRIVNDSLVPAGFAVQTDVQLASELRFAERTRFRAGAILGHRNFRGDPLVIASPFAKDDFQSYSLGVTRQLGERLNLNLDGQYSNRNTDTGVNEYHFTRLVAGVSYRF
ncbi:hypothetical protein QE360_002751 [Sphingomonas sp. SORGH_AS789]|nr:hypothetical protein [Sphingomonas sp. SORGH_AS_0789]MDR6150547.1 hypothetical protein [Sphingomonas sp. SORGH_AS_0742]